ncbi:MAG: sulfite exporter TauE/SafE family protein [Pelagibaca sp.]
MPISLEKTAARRSRWTPSRFNGPSEYALTVVKGLVNDQKLFSQRPKSTAAAIGNDFSLRPRHTLKAILRPLGSGETFLWIVLWILMLGTALFAGGPFLLRAFHRRGRGSAGLALSVTGVLIVSIYGAYFNGGLGSMLLATFGLLGHIDLHGMNGLKNLLATVLSLVSAAAFIWADLIAWEEAFIMAISATLGGYTGARLSRRIVRIDLLRGHIMLSGVVFTVAFFTM